MPMVECNTYAISLRQTSKILLFEVTENEPRSMRQATARSGGPDVAWSTDDPNPIETH